MEDLAEEMRDIDGQLSKIDENISLLHEQKRLLLAKKAHLEEALAVRHRVSDRNWESESFAWSSELKQVLHSVFKMSHFRELQLSALNASLSGEDVVLVMSTGGGKSLTYQLPAFLRSSGLTLVVSPLVALMEDQLCVLESIGIARGVVACLLNASSSPADINRIQAMMIDATSPLKLLYVTPEKLAKSKRFMAKLELVYRQGRLDRIAVDEVHCCSSWGNDFRPDYKFLSILKRQFPKTPLIGLTATATDKVLADVKSMLGITSALVFRTSFNRKNLFYEVRAKPTSNEAVVADLTALITARFSGQSGIVYTFSRKETEELTLQLQQAGLRACCYHADLPPDARARAHRRWIKNDVQIIVATVAFGMGIDKPDVRFVIHHSLPKSVENFFQESGRAGRDGARASCILYYRFSDVFRQSTMVCTEQTGCENLYKMVAYCLDTRRCRREIIALNFGEAWSSTCSRMCDVCRAARQPTTANVIEFLAELLSILSAARDKAQRLTAPKLVELWHKQLAAEKRRTAKSVPANSSGVHLAAAADRTLCERVVAYLLLEGYLKEDYHFTPFSIISYVEPARSVRGDEIRMDLPLHEDAGDDLSEKTAKGREGGRTVVTSKTKRRRVMPVEGDDAPVDAATSSATVIDID